MVILTAASSDTARDEAGRIYKNFSFKGVIGKTIKKAKQFGYTPVVYDLHSLGMGEKFTVKDKSFVTKGYYEKEVQKGYRSKSLFKPEIVKKCLDDYNDFTVYLDGDAQLCASIDEVVGDDYDIGVTLRDSREFERKIYNRYSDILKYINAGVIFFNNTPSAKRFVDNWQKATERVGNDQMALNQLACTTEYPEAYSIHVIDGIRIKYFPGNQYNYYYFKKGLVGNIKIMHFKGGSRIFYPFDWRKRLYCLLIVPTKNMVKSLFKKLKKLY